MNEQRRRRSASPSAALGGVEERVTKEKEDLARRRNHLRHLLVQDGGAYLGEAQLLELLLGYATSRRDPEPLARALLERYHSMEGVLRAAGEPLLETEGMSENALVLLRLAACLEQRRGPKETEALKTVEQWIGYLLPLFQRQRRERVYLLCLSSEKRLRECAFLGEGNDCAVNLDVNRVCETARRSGAESVVLAHSHPSGVALPSQADILTTRSCRAALDRLGVRLLDHLVFTDEDCVSMAESGLL